MENNDELLRLQKRKEQNRRYYLKNRERIIASVKARRRDTNPLTKARWCLKYWEKQVRMLEALEQEQKLERGDC